MGLTVVSDGQNGHLPRRFGYHAAIGGVCGLALRVLWKRVEERMIKIVQQGSDVLVSVKVVPGSSRDRIMGELGDALKVAVAAPPEKGAANKAVCSLIARVLGIRAQSVTVDAGHSSPRKTVRIANADVATVQQALSA